MVTSLIIFVCTSNTCRSPMAEQFAKSWLSQNNLSTQHHLVISRALSDKYEPPNSEASYNGIKVLAEDYSLDLSYHRSAMLSHKDVETATYIIGVTQSHAKSIQDMFPSSIGKVYTLQSDIPDPWHSSIEVYRTCALKMEPLVYEILIQLIH
jgi:protein-tyrosine-phosphatase